MLVLGIETSCDDTGVALFDSDRGILAEALHSQVAMHTRYGGVVPELASRDHLARLSPMIVRCMLLPNEHFMISMRLPGRKVQV